MEAMSWLAVVRATPQRPLSSLLGPERLGILIVQFKYILMRRARAAINLAAKTHAFSGHPNYLTDCTVCEVIK